MFFRDNLTILNSTYIYKHASFGEEFIAKRLMMEGNMARFLFLVVFSLLPIHHCVLGFDEGDEDDEGFAMVGVTYSGKIFK